MNSFFGFFYLYGLILLVSEAWVSFRAFIEANNMGGFGT